MIHWPDYPAMADLPKPMMPVLSSGPIDFVREVYIELTKVTWPGRAEVVKLTVIVVVISVAIGIYIGSLDFVLTKLTDYLIKK